MRKYLIGFIVAMALIIPLSNVKAETIQLDTTYFAQSEYDLESIAINVAQYNNIILDEYDYVFMYYERRVNLFFAPRGYLKSGQLQNPGSSSAVISYKAYLNPNDIYYYYQISTGALFDFSTAFNNVKLTKITGQSSYLFLTSNTDNYTRFIVYASDDVIDTNGNTIYQKTPDFVMKITSAEACDLQNRDIIVYTVDLTDCYRDNYVYQYSYDNTNFYNMDVTSNNKIYYLNHGLPIKVYFRIIDNNGNIVYETEANDYYESIKKEIIIKESFKNDTEKQIIIDFDFAEYAQFNDTYNMKFYVENELLDTTTKTIILTKDNYKSAIDLSVFIDELEIYDIYRVGQLGSGGGSDSTFDEIYNNIVNDSLENELNSDFSTTKNMIDSVLNFINTIKSFIVIFFELIMRFFNNLNVWIRTCIIALFIELVICKIIKAIRK